VPAGVTGLPKNFALLDVLLTKPQQKDEGSRLCESCDDKHPATSCCLDCKEDMCEDAARWHARNKASRDHRVVSLEELKANPKLAAVSVFCSEHNEQFRFFDEECGHVVCRDCVTLKHNGHKCLSLTEAASKYRQEMETLATKASTHAEEIKTAEARVEGVSLDLKQAYEKKAALIQAALIQGTFKELHAALTAREQVLMNELDHLLKTKTFTLTEQRDRLRTFQACLESAVQRAKAAIQSPGNAELLVARSDVVSTLQALESQPPVLEPQTRCILEFVVDHEQLLDVLNMVGVVKDTSTCANTTTAEGSGLKWAALGRKASFTITARDVQGSPCGVSGDLFAVELKDEKGDKKVEVNLKDNGDGTYLATYTVPADITKGDLKLSVLLPGAHIQGSPFVVRLVDVPVGRVTCWMCGQQTRSMSYYKNDNAPNRSGSFRVNGYSALCDPGCTDYGNKDRWTLVCGPS